jgi:hypothetical protein
MVFGLIAIALMLLAPEPVSTREFRRLGCGILIGHPDFSPAA